VPRERLPSSPSLSDHHDQPGALAQWELDVILERCKIIEDRLAQLEARALSSPPNAVTVTSPTNWRVRAPIQFAWALVVVMTLLAIAWGMKDRWR